MDVYTELAEKIKKLERNETQMTSEQRVKYAAQLMELRERVCALAAVAIWGFMLSDIKILKYEGGDTVERISGIIREELNKGVGKRAENALFSTYSPEEFYKILSPAQCRVFYEGYGPYWVRHCRPVKEKDNAADVSYYNDIIDMYWSDDMQVWKRKGMWETAVMLPPTMELIQAEFEAVKSEMTGGFDER